MLKENYTYFSDSGCNGTELSRSQEIEVVLTGIVHVDEDNLSLATGEVMVDATKSVGFAQWPYQHLSSVSDE